MHPQEEAQQNLAQRLPTHCYCCFIWFEGLLFNFMGSFMQDKCSVTKELSRLS